jgi:hypothetical protein
MMAACKKQLRPAQGPSPRAQLGMVGLALLVAAALWSTRGKIARRPPLAPGVEIEAPITLVASDRDDLACSIEREVNGLHCAFAAPERSRSSGDRRLLVAPYLTLDRELYLIAGLFEQPAVRARAERDRALTTNRDAQPRFTAHCRLELVELVRDVRTRWSPSGPWSPPSEAWVARPSNCRIE